MGNRGTSVTTPVCHGPVWELSSKGAYGREQLINSLAAPGKSPAGQPNHQGWNASVARISQLAKDRLSDAGGLRFEPQAERVAGRSTPILCRACALQSRASGLQRITQVSSVRTEKTHPSRARDQQSKTRVVAFDAAPALPPATRAIWVADRPPSLQGRTRGPWRGARRREGRGSDDQHTLSVTFNLKACASKVRYMYAICVHVCVCVCMSVYMTMCIYSPLPVTPLSHARASPLQCVTLIWSDVSSPTRCDCKLFGSSGEGRLGRIRDGAFAL